MSVVINSFSVGEAKTLTAICCVPANINHSPIPQDTNLFFSASESPRSSLSDLIDVVDCLSKTCNDEFEIIGFPYLLLTKSSISCEIVVIPSPYFLALLISPNKNSAEVSCWSMIHASSHTRSLGLLCDLTLVRMKFNALNMAGVLSTSSRSLILNTVILLLMSMLV